MVINNKSIFHYVTAPAPRYMLRLAVLNQLFKKYLVGAEISFIEIGPGGGDVAEFLAGHAEVASGVVIDFSREVFDKLQARFSGFDNLRVCQGELKTADETTSVDLLLAFEVLEHVEDDDGFLQTMASHLKPDGLLFISVPAYMNKWQNQDDWAGHLRRYEKEELEQKLLNAGFEIKEMLDYGFPLTTILYPFKKMYYSNGETLSSKDKTKKSGIDRSLFGGRPSWLLLCAYYPFIIMQRFFYTGFKGDGLVVVASKR